MSDFFDSIMHIDYASLDLKPIEQLVFIKIAYILLTSGEESIDCSITFLCNKFNCTKPTIHNVLSRLEGIGLLTIKRTLGSNNRYYLNKAYIETLFSMGPVTETDIVKPIFSESFLDESFALFEAEREEYSKTTSEKSVKRKKQIAKRNKARKNRKNKSR